MYNCIACCISWCVSYNLQTVNERLSAYRSASPPAKAKGETSTIYETSKVRRYERERASLKWKGEGGARGGASVVTVTWFQGQFCIWAVLFEGKLELATRDYTYPRLKRLIGSIEFIDEWTDTWASLATMWRKCM